MIINLREFGYVCIGSFETNLSKKDLSSLMDKFVDDSNECVVLEVFYLHPISELDDTKYIDLSLKEIHDILFNNDRWLTEFNSMSVEKFLTSLSDDGDLMDFLNNWLAESIVDEL